MRKNNRQLISVLMMISVELCSLAGYTMPAMAGVMADPLIETSLSGEEMLAEEPVLSDGEYISAASAEEDISAVSDILFCDKSKEHVIFKAGTKFI